MRQSRSMMATLSVVLSKIIVIRAAASSAFSFASDNSCSRCSSASAIVLNAPATWAISDLSAMSTRRGIITQPPLVRGVDQLAKRAMDEPPGAQ